MEQLVPDTDPASAPTRTEATEIHSRLLRCSLCIEESRAYWANINPDRPRASALGAFEQSWFGTKSEAWTTELLSNMRVRFDAFPDALRVLAAWRSMRFETRRLICHLHVQLTDPLYRTFTGAFLPERRESIRPSVQRQAVIDWVAANGPARWALKTQIQFATRLLSCSLAAGLLGGNRDPREALRPRVPDELLSYLLYLLRETSFEGTLIANPYLSSLGIVGGIVDDRFHALSSIDYRRVGSTFEIGWRYPDLASWARAELGEQA
ncbi:MAG: DUF1819 domain-containing protein [Myxococcota bacterium]|nr:DUF1819 domain-containing protein [Myxococcota bacterium]